LVRSVAADPVVDCWPGALSERPGRALVFFWCPGAYSEAPFVVGVGLFCIWCPGEFAEEPGDFVLLCAKAAAVSSTVETVSNVFSIGLSFLQVTEANVSPVVMFRFFPIATAGRFNLDEQAFIFAPHLTDLIMRSASRRMKTEMGA
jgi:hypothetical protein